MQSMITKEGLQQLAAPLDEKLRLGGLNAALACIDAILMIRSLASQHEADEAAIAAAKKEAADSTQAQE